MQETETVVVVVQECANGNGEVGEMWLETATFHRDATIGEVLEWRRDLHKPGGRLMITVGSDFTRTPPPAENGS